MLCLVIGGSGFIGSHILDSLIARGYRVRVVGRREPAQEMPRNVEYIRGDYADSNLIDRALMNVGAVFHCASATFPSTAPDAPFKEVHENLLPTLTLLKAMERQDVRRIIYLSSGGTVYGMVGSEPTTERHPLRPCSAYGITKVSIESYLQNYGKVYGFLPLIIRPSNPYGERQGHVGVQGAISTFLHRIARDETIEIWGDGSIIRDYIYVQDVAEIAVTAFEKGLTGALNAGSGRGVSIVDLLKEIEVVTGRQPRAEYKPSRVVDIPVSFLNMSKVESLLDWKGGTQLSEGLASTWRWILEGVVRTQEKEFEDFPY